MNIKLITDCTGIKQDAIKGIFLKRFEPNPVEIIVQKGENFSTPLTLEDFFLTTERRMQQLIKNAPHPDHYFSTIQKGYYRSKNLWYFSACIAIALPLFTPLCVMACSAPVTQEASKKKDGDLSRNFSDILAEEFPKWNKDKDSVFTLLTGEDEKMWLQQPLRHCAKILKL